MLAVIPSYFRESGAFLVVADIPSGRTCRTVRELVSGTRVTDARIDGRRVTLPVTMTADDYLKVYLFEWA